MSAQALIRGQSADGLGRLRRRTAGLPCTGGTRSWKPGYCRLVTDRKHLCIKAWPVASCRPGETLGLARPGHSPLTDHEEPPWAGIRTLTIHSRQRPRPLAEDPRRRGPLMGACLSPPMAAAPRRTRTAPRCGVLAPTHI